jgi:Lysophospholipase L1 and related esterases
MKKQIICSLIFCVTFSVAHATRINFNKLFNTGISYTGRTVTDAKGNVNYDWIGTYLQTDFTGGSIAVDIAETDTSYHNVFIDGQLLKKIKVYGKQPHAVVLVENLPKGMHRLRLQKCTEGQYGMTTVSGFYLANGNLTYKVPAKKRFIEVYGDSYTCGYGTEGLKYNEPFRLSTENCNKAYGCIIARYFDADYALVAHSGQGMVRDWADKNQMSDINMYIRHDKVMDQHDTTAYSFDAYKPSLVMINLGTNDFSPTAIPTDEQYVGQYLKLIASLRKHYGNVPILCITPHSATRYLSAALQLLKERVADDKNVHMANLLANIIVDNTDLGSDWHPNYIGQRKIAMTLIPQISAMMGWPLSDDVVK